MYMMVSGDRAELRGLNLEGLRRCGFSDLEVRKSLLQLPYYVNSGACKTYAS
jgi:acyl-[acyl carrier protein]--UDP-N-acetylglucosamine O-acyltransferase